MDKFDRIQQLHRIFSEHRYPLTCEQLAQRLECSTKTVQRSIELMLNHLNAPLISTNTPKAWQYQPQSNSYELPGLWLTSQELQSLILLLHLLKNLGKGLLNQELSFVEKQIHQLLSARKINLSQFNNKINIIALGYRHMHTHIFEKVATALLQQRDVQIDYRDFKQQSTTQRQLSPQRLVFYRENWYVDAWCHQRQDLRTFAVARIQQVQITTTPAKPVADEQLNTHFAKGYGLFAGIAPHTAQLRFLPRIAHEIASQHWHPQQTGHWENTDYVLRVPYAKDDELLLDILRYTPDVIVESPPELQAAVIKRLQQGLAMYNA